MKSHPYMALRYIGDFPIVTSVLSDDYQAVRKASRRRPRNEVARFILEDLDNAYELMLQTPPMTNRLTKDCAALNRGNISTENSASCRPNTGRTMPNRPDFP